MCQRGSSLASGKSFLPLQRHFSCGIAHSYNSTSNDLSHNYVPFGKRKKLIRDDTATCDDILLQTLGMESSFFNKIRKTHSSVNNDLEVFCERFDRNKMPKFAPSSGNSPLSSSPTAASHNGHLHNNHRNYSTHRKNAKRKLNQILQLLAKEISSSQKSKAGILPETAVRNIMRSLDNSSPQHLPHKGSSHELGVNGLVGSGTVDGENGSNNVYLISKVETGSKLNLDSLRQFGLVSQSICDGVGSRVVDIGSTGTIEPFAVMNNKGQSSLLSLQKSPSHILSSFNFKATDARIAGAFESAAAKMAKLENGGRFDASLLKHLNGSSAAMSVNVEHLNGVPSSADACQKSPDSPSRTDVIVSNRNFRYSTNIQQHASSLNGMNGINGAATENGKLFKIVSSLTNGSTPPAPKFCPKKKFITELTNGKNTFSFGVNSLDMLPSHVNVNSSSLVGKNGVTLSAKNDIIT